MQVWCGCCLFLLAWHLTMCRWMLTQMHGQTLFASRLQSSHLHVKANRCCLHNKTFRSTEWMLVLNFTPQLSCTSCPLPHHWLPTLCVCSIWYLSLLLQRQRCSWLTTGRVAHTSDWKRERLQQEWNLRYIMFLKISKAFINIFDWFTSDISF